MPLTQGTDEVDNNDNNGGDNDGDNDLLVGASDGTLQYWRNDGNSSHPRFVRADGADDPFGGIRFDPKQAEDIINKVAKGKQGN